MEHKNPHRLEHKNAYRLSDEDDSASSIYDNSENDNHGEDDLARNDEHSDSPDVSFGARVPGYLADVCRTETSYKTDT